MLSFQQKEDHLNWCKFVTEKYDREYSHYIWDIITGDGVWMYQYDPETKHQSTVWVFEEKELPTKFKKAKSMNKNMLACFFMRSGHLKSKPLKNRRTVNADWYTNVCPPEVYHCVEHKWQRTGICGLQLLHDNASGHTAAKTLDFLTTRGVTLATHLSYSLDLAYVTIFCSKMQR